MQDCFLDGSKKVYEKRKEIQNFHTYGNIEKMKCIQM